MLSMGLLQDDKDRMFNDGFAIVERVLAPEQIDSLRSAIGAIPEGEEV
jgi:hypothetical protein